MSQKVWLVTGASRGIGAEIAKAVLAAGDQLVAAARKVETLDYLGKQDNVFNVAMDVTNEEGVQEAVKLALAHFGRIDVLVNNAGYGLLGGVEESSGTEVEKIYRTNVFGLLNVTRAVLPSMRERRSGYIFNLSSIGGYASVAGWGVYSSTKFAVEGISEALHAEVAPLGIHVTIVEPGYFRTDFLDASSMVSTKTQMPDYAGTVGKIREFAVGHNHQQPGDPTKIGAALVQLANAANPPLRLPLGTDALATIAEKNAFVAKETDQWKTLSASTDF
ncbi:oxidoreductase [Granulicella sp. dw_53]|uniref:oxidoreductase n=1 Tax=Granulicella sp. dw_53 TaxID=2719792 RepID=UPI001BD57595|nr:oxidoreductase [Granulicella sp. dw_53]